MASDAVDKNRDNDVPLEKKLDDLYISSTVSRPR